MRGRERGKNGFGYLQMLFPAVQHRGGDRRGHRRGEPFPRVRIKAGREPIYNGDPDFRVHGEPGTMKAETKAGAQPVLPRISRPAISVHSVPLSSPSMARRT